MQIEEGFQNCIASDSLKGKSSVRNKKKKKKNANPFSYCTRFPFPRERKQTYKGQERERTLKTWIKMGVATFDNFMIYDCPPPAVGHN